MIFEEWYENNVKYMTLTDFKPWLHEAWLAAQEEAAKLCWENKFGQGGWCAKAIKGMK